jgi:hypothetical protein
MEEGPPPLIFWQPQVPPKQNLAKTPRSPSLDYCASFNLSEGQKKSQELVKKTKTHFGLVSEPNVVMQSWDIWWNPGGTQVEPRLKNTDLDTVGAA